MYSTTILKRAFVFAVILPFVFSMGCQNRSAVHDESQDESLSEWQNLFDGKTLDGWKVVGGEETMPEYIIDELILLAHKQDVPYQSLIKIFLKERINQELRQA